mgnify:CR=1 FL=1
MCPKKGQKNADFLDFFEEKNFQKIKTVNSKDQVEFYAIDIAQSDSYGAWVTGLPERVKIIINGHGFVKQGNTVEPVLKPHNLMSSKEDV